MSIIDEWLEFNVFLSEYFSSGYFLIIDVSWVACSQISCGPVLLDVFRGIHTGLKHRLTSEMLIGHRHQEDTSCKAYANKHKTGLLFEIMLICLNHIAFFISNFIWNRVKLKCLKIWDSKNEILTRQFNSEDKGGVKQIILKSTNTWSLFWSINFWNILSVR